MKTIILILSILIINNLVFYYTFIPRIIEKRAKDLDLMQYNGEKEKFVGKDSVLLNQWEIYYLQYGNTNGY
jgi:hypothetical protein